MEALIGYFIGFSVLVFIIYKILTISNIAQNI